MGKVYVESRHDLDLLRHGFRYMTMANFKKELSDTIKSVRAFQFDQRRGNLAHIESYDCGRQDAFYAKVDALYFKFAALKLAYKLKRGDATMAQDVFNNLVGNHK